MHKSYMAPQREKFHRNKILIEDNTTLSSLLNERKKICHSQLKLRKYNPDVGALSPVSSESLSAISSGPLTPDSPDLSVRIYAVEPSSSHSKHTSRRISKKRKKTKHKRKKHESLADQFIPPDDGDAFKVYCDELSLSPISSDSNEFASSRGLSDLNSTDRCHKSTKHSKSKRKRKKKSMHCSSKKKKLRYDEEFVSQCRLSKSPTIDISSDSDSRDILVDKFDRVKKSSTSKLKSHKRISPDIPMRETAFIPTSSEVSLKKCELSSEGYDYVMKSVKQVPDTIKFNRILYNQVGVTPLCKSNLSSSSSMNNSKATYLNDLGIEINKSSHYNLSSAKNHNFIQNSLSPSQSFKDNHENSRVFSSNNITAIKTIRPEPIIHNTYSKKSKHISKGDASKRRKQHRNLKTLSNNKEVNFETNPVQCSKKTSDKVLNKTNGKDKLCSLSKPFDVKADLKSKSTQIAYEIKMLCNNLISNISQRGCTSDLIEENNLTKTENLSLNNVQSEKTLSLDTTVIFPNGMPVPSKINGCQDYSKSLLKSQEDPRFRKIIEDLHQFTENQLDDFIDNLQELTKDQALKEWIKLEIKRIKSEQSHQRDNDPVSCSIVQPSKSPSSSLHHSKDSISNDSCNVADNKIKQESRDDFHDNITSDSSENSDHKPCKEKEALKNDVESLKKVYHIIRREDYSGYGFGILTECVDDFYIHRTDEIKNNSPAAYSGLVAGLIILKINEYSAHNINHEQIVLLVQISKRVDITYVHKEYLSIYKESITNGKIDGFSKHFFDEKSIVYF